MHLGGGGGGGGIGKRGAGNVQGVCVRSGRVCTFQVVGIICIARVELQLRNSRAFFSSLDTRGGRAAAIWEGGGGGGGTVCDLRAVGRSPRCGQGPYHAHTTSAL